MDKKEFEKKIASLIRKYDDALAFDDIQMTEYTLDIDDGEELIYAEFTYQIDDRIDDNGGRDSDVDIIKHIINDIGDKFGVDLNRMDAFPNGYATYKLTIDS